MQTPAEAYACFTDLFGVELNDLLQPFSISAEQNGAIVNGRMNYSFGNGNENTDLNNPGGWGVVIPFPITVVSMTLGSRLAANGSTIQVDLTKVPLGTNDAIAQGAVVTIPTGDYIGTATVSVDYDTGDVLNFVTVSNGGGNDVVPTAWAVRKL